jgi:hypothetical protein
MKSGDKRPSIHYYLGRTHGQNRSVVFRPSVVISRPILLEIPELQRRIFSAMTMSRSRITRIFTLDSVHPFNKKSNHLHLIKTPIISPCVKYFNKSPIVLKVFQQGFRMCSSCTRARAWVNGYLLLYQSGEAAGKGEVGSCRIDRYVVVEQRVVHDHVAHPRLLGAPVLPASGIGLAPWVPDRWKVLAMSSTNM